MGSKWQLVTHAIHDEVDDLILCDGTHKVMTTLILLIFILGFGWKWHQTCLVTSYITVGFSLFYRIDVIAFSKQVFIGEWRVIQGWGSRSTLFPIEFLLWRCSGWTTCSMGAGTYHWQKTEASPPPGLMSWSEHTMTGLS